MSAPTASPTGSQLGPGKTLKYSELTPQVLAVLRLDAALESAYGNTRSSTILSGHAQWLKTRSSRTPQVAGDRSREAINPNDFNSSRDPQRKPSEVSGG